jgi:prophage maintenance system killer protein
MTPFQLINAEQVFALHTEAINRWGGKRSTRTDSEDCIEGRIGNAALAEDYVTDDERVRRGLCFAGFLLFYLCRDHCFIDGNKRVRIPGQGEEDSGMNAKSVPERRQTRFRAEGEQ